MLLFKFVWQPDSSETNSDAELLESRAEKLFSICIQFGGDGAHGVKRLIHVSTRSPLNLVVRLCEHVLLGGVSWGGGSLINQQFNTPLTCVSRPMCLHFRARG